MFLLHNQLLLRAVEQLSLWPTDTLAISNAFKEGTTRKPSGLFEMLPNVSIDYAVMERSEEVFVLRANFPWDDVGGMGCHGSIPRTGFEGKRHRRRSAPR